MSLPNIFKLWPKAAKTPEAGATIEFVLIAEAGPLEHQAVLLCESIRLFAGRHSQQPITVVSPRADRRPSPAVIEKLKALDCNYVMVDVDSIEPEYGTTFRMYVSAHVETHSQADVLVVLDSDIIFTEEPDLALDGKAAAIRPVDVKGLCSTGRADPYDDYWCNLCELTGVSYEAIPMLTTTVDRLLVKASYNGGFIVARRDCGIFNRTLDYFKLSMMAGLRPRPYGTEQVNAGHGLVSPRGTELWGTSQACLSLAIWGSGLEAKLLPPSHNVPVHMFNEMSKAGKAMRPVTLHYHRLFYEDAASNPILNGQIRLPAPVKRWLSSRLDAFAQA